VAKIQIVTDSTAYFTKEEANALDIKVVPLSVHFDGQVDSEGFPGEFEAFYKKLESSDSFPSTSQPSIEAFERVFESALDQGMEVICLVISSDLSGTYNSASAAARLTNPKKISVIDSRTSVANLKLLTKLAVDMVSKGKTRQEIVSYLERQKKKVSVSLTVDSLEYLKRGGRLTGPGPIRVYPKCKAHYSPSRWAACPSCQGPGQGQGPRKNGRRYSRGCNRYNYLSYTK